MLTTRIVTEWTSWVDLTGVSDIILTFAYFAEGDRENGAFAAAGIAVPGGLDKIAKKLPWDKIIGNVGTGLSRATARQLDDTGELHRQFARRARDEGDDVAEEIAESASSRGIWRSPREWADIDHDELRDRLRREFRDRRLESGRHNEYPRAMERELRRLAKEAEQRGDLPDYMERLREIAETYRRRAREGHRGGWGGGRR